MAPPNGRLDPWRGRPDSPEGALATASAMTRGVYGAPWPRAPWLLRGRRTPLDPRPAPTSSASCRAKISPGAPGRGHTGAMARAQTKWTGEGAGRHYAGDRFRSPRSRGRDARMVLGLLDRHGSPGGSILDAPSGTGRLRAALEPGREYLALDYSASMLAECGGARVQGEVHALPFPDDHFDTVVCCRLLHHLGPAERRLAIGELVRVCRGVVIASFWDSRSWHALRRRRGLRQARPADTRLAVPRAALRADFESAGANVVGHAASFRYLSPQTFVAAAVHGR